MMVVVVVMVKTTGDSAHKGVFPVSGLCVNHQLSLIEFVNEYYTMIQWPSQSIFI